MILLPWLIGKAGGAWLYERSEKSEHSVKDCLLTGWMVLIGLAEVAHLMGVLTGWSFLSCVNLFWGEALGMAILSILSLVLFYGVFKKGNQMKKGRFHSKKERFQIFKDKKTMGLCVIFLLLFLVQAGILLFSERIYLTGDMTVETVQTFFSTDKIFQNNPMTGMPYELGMPLRLKILGLPTFYGSICRVVPWNVAFVIRKLVPLYVLAAFYMAYGTLADYFWQSRKDLKMVFLIAVGILLFASNGMYGTDGFDLLFAGYRGVTIKACVLVPYTISTVLRKKWLLTLLCILAEACIVWTFYGFGTCFLAAGVMLLLTLVVRRAAKK